MIQIDRLEMVRNRREMTEYAMQSLTQFFFRRYSSAIGVDHSTALHYNCYHGNALGRFEGSYSLHGFWSSFETWTKSEVEENVDDAEKGSEAASGLAIPSNLDNLRKSHLFDVISRTLIFLHDLKSRKSRKGVLRRHRYSSSLCFSAFLYIALCTRVRSGETEEGSHRIMAPQVYSPNGKRQLTPVIVSFTSRCGSVCTGF
jgi:hypothetical protein